MKFRPGTPEFGLALLKAIIKDYQQGYRADPSFVREQRSIADAKEKLGSEASERAKNSAIKAIETKKKKAEEALKRGNNYYGKVRTKF